MKNYFENDIQLFTVVKIVQAKAQRTDALIIKNGRIQDVQFKGRVLLNTVCLV